MGKKILSVETVFPTEGTVKRTKLVLSNEKFKEMVELDELDESWLSKSIFPAIQTLALMAHLVYEDDSGSVNRGWQLLITAKNEADNYFGAAFWNGPEQQLVLSHRGTNNLKAVLTDIEGVIRNRHTSQIDSACTFVAHVLHELSKLKRFNQIQISITGHSLGAWLAQITTFSTEYLTLDRETHKFRLKTEEDFVYHAHCVGFESPGCREMLTKLSEMYHPRYQNPEHSFWTNLDITLHLTRPNMINTFCKHVGKLNQIDIRGLDKKKDNFINYTLHYHSRKNIVSALTEDCAAKEIHDWPLLTFPEKTKNDGPDPSKFNLLAVGKILWSVPNLFYHYLRSNRLEVEEFGKRASHENNYSPEHEDDIKYGIKFHYRVEEVDKRICLLNTFSEVEQFFLFYWQNFNTLSLENKSFIKEEITKALLKVHSKLKLEQFEVPFADLSHDEDYFMKMGFKRMKFNRELNVKKFISFIKQLFRFFDNRKDFVRSFAQNTEANVLICKTFSEGYLQRINVKCLTFIDNIDLKQFLNFNQGGKIFLIRSKFKFEIQRIQNILSSDANRVKQFIYLDLDQIDYLNSCLNLPKTFASMPDYVIVLACQQENLDKKDLQMLNIFLENIKVPNSIIIVAQSALIETNYHVDCILEVNDANLYLRDLTTDSKNVFMNLLTNKEIILQGKNIKLFNFIKGDKIEALDSSVVAELMKEDKVLEIGRSPMKLYQSETSYAKRLKFIQTEYLIEAFKKDSNARKSEIFVIANNSNEFGLEQFIHLLQITNEIDKHKIMRLTKIFKIGNENIEYDKCAKINVLKSGDETLFKKICSYNTEKIVYWLEIINERFYLLQVFDTDFYIKRNLYHNKRIKRVALLDLFLSEKFVLSATDLNRTEIMKSQIIERVKQLKNKIESESEKKELDEKINRNVFISFNENDALNKFNDWCAESKDTPVHWLTIISNQLVWKQSHFSLNELRKYLDIQLIDEQTLANLNNKVVVVVAEPGMGKSTTLTHLSEYKLHDNWVIRLNLKDYLNQILSLPNYYYEIDAVVKFLLWVSHSDINCKLTATLLKFSLTHHTFYPVLILFDGYDEIDRDHQSKLITLLKYLKENTFANLWITSRKHFTGDLENKLCVFSTTFKELNLDERQMFLKTYWQVRLRLELSDSEFNAIFGNEGHNLGSNKFQAFSNALLVKVDEVLSESQSKFMGIPLQMRLLAEGFLPQFETFIKSELDDEVPHFNELNVAQIYEKFIKVKFEIYFQEKTRLSFGLNKVSAKWFSDDIIKIHQKLALRFLFPEISKHLLEKDFAIGANEEMELNRIGLVHCPHYVGEIEFIHRTFAEYFVASLILDCLRKPIHPKQFDAIESLLKLVFQKFDVICSFLNEQILETDVALVKTGCFSKNIFDYLDKPCKNNHANLIKFVSSFFKNKVSRLNQCKLHYFLRISLNSKNSEIAQAFLSLTIHHYDVLRKNLLQPSYEIGEGYRYKLRNNSCAIYCRLEACKRDNVKSMMDAIKCHTKILEELIQDYYLEDLFEIFKDDEDLCQLMHRLKRDENAAESEINKLVNSIRDKYKENIGNEIYRLKSFIESNNNRYKDQFEDSKEQIEFLDEFLDLMSEDKPRQVLRDFPSLFRTLNFINTLAIVVDRLKNCQFRIGVLLKENEDVLLDFLKQIKKNCELVDFVKLLESERESQFLRCLMNDEDFSKLLDLLKNFNNNYCKKLEIDEPFKDDENAIREINSCVDIPKVFPCFKYYVDRLRSLSRKALSLEDQVKFVFYGFRNENQPLFSISPPSFLNIFESFLNRVESEETKHLLSHYLPVLAIVESILIDVDLLKLIQILLQQMKLETIKTSRDVLTILQKHSKMTWAIVEDESRILIDVETLICLLQLLFICKGESFYESIGKQDTFDLERMLRFSQVFPGIFCIFIFKVFNSNFQIYNHFSQEKVCLIFEFLFKYFPHLARCLTMSVAPRQNTHFTYALKCNYTKIISLIFKTLKPFPKILKHLVLIPQYKHKSCLHYAIVESELKILEYFLAELNRNVDNMQYVIENFVSNEEEKLNLYEAAETKNAGAILVFLESLKFNEELFKIFVLPADVSVQPAFYLAGERGCKEVMDTLLSALKSEPDLLWELLTRTEPNSGQTVLHRACDRGYTEIVEALLYSIRKQPMRLKSLFSVRDNSGHTALDCAILSKRQVSVQTSFDCNSRNNLIHDINYKDFHENFGNINFINEQMKSLHALSSSLKYFPMVVNLLLVFAKSFNNAELMLAIFENADLNVALESMRVTIDTYSYHLFHCAIERNEIRLVERLLAKGIEVNATNGFGFTPLMRAVYKNRLEIKKLLLNSEADVTLEF